MIKFICPECGSDDLREYESGAVIERTVRIDEQYRTTKTKNYWLCEDGKKWWKCGGCKMSIPVRSEEELVRWIEDFCISGP